MKNSLKHSYVIKGLIVLFFMLTFAGTFAQDPPKKAQPDEKELTQKEKDSIAKLKAEQKAIEEEKAIEEKINNATEKLRFMPIISEETVKCISYLFFIIMLVLIILFFTKTYLMKQHFGFQSIKFIGLSIMFPGICVIALAGGNILSGQTLAALFGTIAGYVFSKDDDSSKVTNIEHEDLKKRHEDLVKDKATLDENNNTLTARIQELETQLAQRGQ